MYTAFRRSSSAKEEGWGEWGEWREGGTRVVSLLSLKTTWKEVWAQWRELGLVIRNSCEVVEFAIHFAFGRGTCFVTA